MPGHANLTDVHIITGFVDNLEFHRYSLKTKKFPVLSVLSWEIGILSWNSPPLIPKYHFPIPSCINNVYALVNLTIQIKQN